MGVSFGGVVLTPLATWLVDTIGWRPAWVWLGVGTAILMYPVALLMRRAPEDHGLHPDWVEAAAFAWLAKRRLENKAGNIPEVTGASSAQVRGCVYSGTG